MSLKLLKIFGASFLFCLTLACSAPVNTVVATINTGVTPTGMAITPDGNFLYIANNNNYELNGLDSVTVINLADNSLVTTIFDPSFNQPYTITINPAGTFAYVTNSNSTTVTVIDLEDNTVADEIEGFDGPSGMVISPDGTRGYVNNYGGPGGAGSGNGTTVSVVNLLTNVIVGQPITVGLAPAALAMSSDGAFVYVVNYGNGNPNNGSMSVIDTSDNSVTTPLALGLFGPFAIAITPDNNFAYVTNFGSNNFTPIGTTVSVIDLSNNTISATIDLAMQPAGLAITPDGKFVYASNYNALYSSNGVYDGVNLVGTVNILVPGQGTVNIIDTATNSVVSQTIAVGQSPANIVISPSGQFAYVSNFVSNTVNVIGLPTFEIQAQGVQIQNRFLTRLELVNQLTWTVSGSSLPVSYAIYRDAALTDQIGSVFAGQTFAFYDHNRAANRVYTYYITGTNEAGITSAPVEVVIGEQSSNLVPN